MAIIKRRVEKSAEATLNVGEMQFLKIKSLISQELEGEESEVNEAEAKLWKELTLDIRRGMWTMIKGLGKTTDADKKLFDSCAQRVQEAKEAKNKQEEKKNE